MYSILTNSRFPDEKTFHEIISDYFIGVICDIKREKGGFKRLTFNKFFDEPYNFYLKASGEQPTFSILYNAVEFDEFGKQIGLLSGKVMFYIRDNKFVDFMNAQENFNLCFNVNVADLDKLLNLYLDELYPDVIWDPVVFSTKLPEVFLNNMINKGYFNLDNYTIEELLKISEYTGNRNIISQEIRDIFIF